MVFVDEFPGLGVVLLVAIGIECPEFVDHRRAFELGFIFEHVYSHTNRDENPFVNLIARVPVPVPFRYQRRLVVDQRVVE